MAKIKSIEVPAHIVVTTYPESDDPEHNPHDYTLMYVKADLQYRITCMFGGDKPSPQPADNLSFNEMLEMALEAVHSETLDGIIKIREARI